MCASSDFQRGRLTPCSTCAITVQRFAPGRVRAHTSRLAATTHPPSDSMEPRRILKLPVRFVAKTPPGSSYSFLGVHRAARHTSLRFAGTEVSSEMSRMELIPRGGF